MARYICQGVWVDQSGNVVKEGTVTPVLAGTSTAADVYAASSGGAAVNSVESDSTGKWVFYVDTATYSPSQKFDITLSKTNFTSKTYSDVQIYPLGEQPFGEIYANDDNPVAVVLTSADTWYLVDDGTDIKAGELNGVTFENSNELRVGTAGRYLINWSMSLTSSGTNDNHEASVAVNDTTEQVKCTAHRYIATGADTGNMGSTCILDLSADDDVRLIVKNEDAASTTCTIDHMNLTLVRLGA